MTDTTDLLTPPAAEAPEVPSDSAPKTRRRATSGGGLASLVLPELQTLATDLGITGIAKMRKGQLIEAIQERQTATPAPAAETAPAETPAAQTPDAQTPDAQTPDDETPDAETDVPVENSSETRRQRPRRAATRPAAAPAQETEDEPGRTSGPRGTDDTDDTGEDERDGDGSERPERIDRGRERFLEREARRQERAAAAAEAAANGQAPEPDNARPSRAERQPAQTERQADRQADRPQAERQDAADEDEFGARRGRFRERGRGRNRSARDRYDEPLVSDDDVLVPIGGILDILENYAFVRTSGYLTGPNDVYVTLQQVRRYGLRRGDAVTGAVRQLREGERRDKYNALVRLDTINGYSPEEALNRPDFGKLTPLYPNERLRLETEPGILTTRIIDLVMPVGKGQRALIVSPPKAGKTTIMQDIANAITTNNPEVHLMVVLVDERPEEVTDMQRSVKGEVIASTFDRPPTDHITVAELSIERAKRLVELGEDVVVLLDNITRLGRAYNLGAPASGRILTGGVDSAALYPPKRFLGAARNIENGGSLTIFATALVETGSAMDTVIFEEFKGTGNAELKLDRNLANKRVFPAIDVDASGTRKDELLLAPQELRLLHSLRRVLHALDATAAMELLLSKVKATGTNVEFLMQIQKTTPEE